MLVIHDLGEIYSGDTIVYAKDDDHRRDELESADALFSMLEPGQHKVLHALLVESNRISYERIVEINQGKIAEGSEELWSFLLKRPDQMKSSAIIAHGEGA